MPSDPAALFRPGAYPTVTIGWMKDNCSEDWEPDRFRYYFGDSFSLTREAIENFHPFYQIQWLLERVLEQGPLREYEKFQRELYETRYQPALSQGRELYLAKKKRILEAGGSKADLEAFEEEAGREYNALVEEHITVPIRQWLLDRMREHGHA